MSDHRPLRSTPVLAALFVAALALAACGNDGSSSASTSAGNGTSAPGAGGTASYWGTSVPSGVAPAPTGTRATVALLETTDLHTNVLGYDYFKLTTDTTLGFDRTLTLIAAARKEFPNTVLLDDGDTIQGTALSDYQALVSPVACDQTLAIYKVMNAAGYDAGNIGNHEFNYGLPYLSQVTNAKLDVANLPAPSAQKSCGGPGFPLVLSNVYSKRSLAPLFQPYTILTRTMTAATPDGKTVSVPIKVGVIGFTPPTIMAWDKRWLDGNVYTVGVREAAERFVPEMRYKGADLVVALSHGGLDNSPYDPTMENGSWYLSKVAGIDALLIGHSHQIFPNATSTVSQFSLPGVDKVKGFVNGVPTVMGNYWGKHLGVIKLELVWDGTKWAVDASKTTVEARSTQNADKSYVAADASVAGAIAAEHAATIAYVKTPIGTSDFEMSTYFADVGDPGAIQIVNQAQADYVAKYVQANLSQYASLPVLSVSAPFKSGFAGGTDYTDVAAGNVAINNAADLYLYPNTIYAVKVNGTDVQNWLETAAKRFNQIDPTKTTQQELVSTFPGYNFDLFTSKDLRYEIDVTKPAGSRIRNLSWKGAPLSPTQEFVIATNNYRASGGGNFPGIDGSKTIYASPDANRDVLIQFIKTAKTITRSANGSDRSWRFTKVATAGPVVFHSAPGKLSLAIAAGISNVSQLQSDDGSGQGLALYRIDLSQ